MVNHSFLRTNNIALYTIPNCVWAIFEVFLYLEFWEQYISMYSFFIVFTIACQKKVVIISGEFFFRLKYYLKISIFFKRDFSWKRWSPSVAFHILALMYHYLHASPLITQNLSCLICGRSYVSKNLTINTMEVHWENRQYCVPSITFHMLDSDMASSACLWETVRSMLWIVIFWKPPENGTRMIFDISNQSREVHATLFHLFYPY